MRLSFWPGPAQSFDDVLTLAKHVEQTGWDGLWYADHFMPNAEDTSGPHNEAWTTISALGALVPRIRIGTLVSGNTYRHPAVLAKMASTLDQITEGRVVLGLGAAWQENEHRAYGIPFYTLGERLQRLDEACQVIRGLFENEKTTFDGKFYQLSEAPLAPKPVQSPLPLFIGGGGEKVTLRITAKWADEWNVWGDVATLKHKMSVLDGHCAEVGRDPAAIQRSAAAMLFLTDDKALAEKLRGGRGSSTMVVGNVEEVRETLRGYAEAGVDELIVPDFNLGPMDAKVATLDRFIQEVAPVVR
ncbi:MAG: LLM class F420-dependent oxidoreductase [Deltaproteobacteria bacterium]|nr:LLM class F420-dependent oxidoreductase [Deltaproteobacteria bacterium]